MKRIILALIAAAVILACIFFFKKSQTGCLIGAFLADNPSADRITDFKKEFGKKPYLVMVFVGWNNLIPERTLSEVYAQKSALFITWEPWDIVSKKGIPLEEISSGKHDGYIKDFAAAIKNIGGPVFIRFAHEVNGDWYPWSGTKVARDKYIAAYRYIKDIFVENAILNAVWVFSVNWEDVPAKNGFAQYYPGDGYVDYIGIDGYNWGKSQHWSRWMSFREIFAARIKGIRDSFKKPLIISEFSSTSSGGNKARWIREAFSYIKREKSIKAFVLFNVDKETDWSFSGKGNYAKELRRQLADPYFAEKPF